MIQVTIDGNTLILIGGVLYIIGFLAVFVSDPTYWKDGKVHYMLYLIPVIGTAVLFIGALIAKC